MSRELFDKYVHLRMYEGHMAEALARHIAIATPERRLQESHALLTHVLTGHLQRIDQVRETYETNPDFQDEITTLLSPVTAAITHHARTETEDSGAEYVRKQVELIYTPPGETPLDPDQRSVLAELGLKKWAASRQSTDPAAQPAQSDTGFQTIRYAGISEQTPSGPENSLPPTLSPAARCILELALQGGVSTNTIRDALINRGIITREQWQERRRSRNDPFSKGRKEVLEYMSAEGIRARWEQSGKASGTHHALQFMTHPTHLATVITRAFHTPPESETATDNDDPTAEANVPQSTSAPEKIEPTTTPVPDSLSVDTETSLDESAMSVLRDVRALIHPLAPYANHKLSWDAIRQVLEVTHTTVDVERIVGALVDSDELHFERVNDVTHLRLGPLKEPTAAPTVVARPRGPSFHNLADQEPTDYFQEAPDIIEAVKQYLANTSGHADEHLFPRLHTAVGYDLERREFFFLLQQMEQQGIITRVRRGTQGQYEAYLAQN